jgi:NADH-quinone oxidoreductase subunit M
MHLPNPLLQTIVVPAFTVLIVALAGRRIGKYAGWISGGVLVYTSLLLVLCGLRILREGPIYEEYVWAEFLNLKWGLLADGLSLPTALIMNVICAACAIYSIDYVEHRIKIEHGEGKRNLHTLYHTLYLLFPVGLVGVSLSTNLIQLYFFFELTLIPSALMIALFGYIDRERVAMMYFIWNHVGASLYLLGVILAYLQVGSFEIAALPRLIGAPLAFWVVLFILLGMLIKMAVFGFHVWLPWAHGEHPTSIAAIIATIVGLGSYIVARVLVQQLYQVFMVFSVPLMVLALITMVYGALLTLAQDDVKRLYACSTISQTAYTLLGLAYGAPLSITGGVFYFLSHCLGKCILFSVAGILLAQTEIRDMRLMGGLASRMPVTAVLCVIGSMILSAIPPFSGFPSELVMFIGIFASGGHVNLSRFIIALLAISATVLTVAYTFWPIRRIFFGPLPEKLKHVREAPLTMTGPLLALSIIALILGVFPKAVMDFLLMWIGNIGFP